MSLFTEQYYIKCCYLQQEQVENAKLYNVKELLVLIFTNSQLNTIYLRGLGALFGLKPGSCSGRGPPA